MAETDKTAKIAAYALIGAVIGFGLVWFVADDWSLGTAGSGLAGGAMAGAIAGFIRDRAGLDKT